MSLGAGLESFSSGLASGYQIGSNIINRRENRELEKQKIELNSKINSLKEIQLQQSIDKEERLKLIEKENQAAVKFRNNVDKGTEYFKVGERMSDPSQRIEYFSNMKEMPFYQNAPATTKTMWDSMSNLLPEEANEFIKITDKFKKAQAKNDKDGMYQAYFEGLSKYGNNENMQPFFTAVGKMLNIPDKSYTQTRIDPNTGEVIITEGQGKLPEEGLTRGTKTSVEKELVSSLDQLAQIRAIQKSANLEFVNAQSVLKNKFLKAKENLTGKRLKGEEKKFVDEFKIMTGDVATLYNERLNALFGSAVTPLEAANHKMTVPNFKGNWEDIISGEGATAFESSMNNFEDKVMDAIARKMYVLQSGGNIEGLGTEQLKFYDKNGRRVQLNDMSSIVNEYADNQYEMIKKSYPDINETEAIKLVNKSITQMFGI